MAYELISRETYRGYPTSREELNGYSTSTHVTLEDVVKAMHEESKDIRSKLELIREWTEKSGNRVIHRELYKAKNGHGRILKKYEIAKSYIQTRVFDDSLI